MAVLTPESINLALLRKMNATDSFREFAVCQHIGRSRAATAIDRALTSAALFS